MANSGSLGTLSVDVVANVAQMVSDLGKAQSESAKATQQIQRQWTELGSGIKDAFAEIGAAIGVGFSIDGLVEMVKSATEAANQIKDLSQSIGASTPVLQTLGYTAALTGSSLDVMAGALEKLERSANDAANGNKQAVEAFRAIGVSAQQAAVLMKDPDQLIQVVTKHLSEFQDGAGKTAVTMQLMGRGAAQNIPVINELGESFDQLQEKARQVGVVLSEEDTAALDKANQGFNAIGQDIKGLGNQLAIDLLPTITKLSAAFTEWIESDAVKSGIKLFAQNIETLVDDLAGIPEELRATSAEFSDWTKSIIGANQELGSLLDLLPKIQAGAAVKISWTEPDWLKFLDAELGGTPQSIWANVEHGAATAAQAVDEFGLHLADSGKHADEATKPLINYNSQVKDLGTKLASADVEAAKFLNSIDGIGADKYTKALDDYNAKLDTADQIFKKLVASGASAAQATQFLADAQAKLKQNLEDVEQSLRNQNDAEAILSRAYAADQSDLNNQIRLLGLDATAREKDALATKLINDALGDMKNVMGPPTEETQKLTTAITDFANHSVDVTTAIKNQNAATQEWVSIWQKAGDQLADTFASILVNGGSLFDGLVSLAKQTVQEIIAYFAKLAIINPILNAIFGGSAGYSQLATLGGSGGIFGGGAAGGAGGGSLGSGGLLDIGKGIWNGMQGGFQSFMQGDSAFTMGPPTEAGSTSSYYGGGYTSGFGQALGIAGGVYAGYNEFQNAGGGAAGAVGGAAYGYGTYAAGAGIATAAATGSIAAGLAAIPVVGWIAIAAMLIDKFSGGKLFGTKGQVQEGSTTLNIGAGGASYATQVSLKGQKALFGGAKWSTQDIAETPEQAAAAKAFFDSWTKAMADFAKQAGGKAVDLVNASFQQVFDKKGNPTGVTHSTIGGYSYDNLTSDQFSQAYGSANEIAVLDQFDSKLEETIATFRQTADGLNEIAAGLVDAQGYLKSGGDFLAIAGKDTLSSIVTLAEGMQASGETIDQTIARLIQAQQQYDQFVGQFKPAATYASDFQAALADINNQLVNNIAQANALAQAAGAEHASTQDLVNIHNYAAQQFAAAVATLKANANSLAASLGYALPQNIDDINSEIAALESKAGSGTKAINSFGQSMQNAAQKATDAMNLLLGDLSPLNDQQKWQAALQGLRAGTATAQQALEIARRLFGTGADYTAAFNQVTALAGQHGGTLQSSFAGGGGGGGGLSAADQQRLDELKKQRDDLQAAQQHADALKLAQEVADYAAAQGVSVEDALKAIGITDVGPFMKELGKTNQDDFDKFIEGLEKQTDSAGDDTADLAAKIDGSNAFLSRIADGVDTLAGIPTAPSGDTPTPPRGHGGHAAPGSAPPPTPNGVVPRGGHSGRGTRQSTDYTRTR